MKPFILILTLLSAPLSIQAQTSDISSALLAEVKQLRAAIERSTLLGTRTQIAIQRLQLQEVRASKAVQELAEVRKSLAEIDRVRATMAGEQKMEEERAAKATDTKLRADMEQHMQRLKANLERFESQGLALRAREAEAVGQLQTEQAKLNQLQGGIDDMERALDAAIRQMTGQR